MLEVGCGVGTDGVRFARNGAIYTGFDGSKEATALAQRRFDLEGLEATFVNGDATSLPFADDSFDLVYSHGVIHHFEQTEKAVEEFRRMLRPGGVAIVMLYHRSSFSYYFTIMTLHRALAALLFLRGGAKLISKVTGEDVKVLKGHKDLLAEHGLSYLTDRELFLSNNTDGPGNPLSKIYAADDSRALFRQWTDVTTTVRFLNLRVFPAGDRLAATALANRLGRRWGWHLYVKAKGLRAVSPASSSGRHDACAGVLGHPSSDTREVKEAPPPTGAGCGLGLSLAGPRLKQVAGRTSSASWTLRSNSSSVELGFLISNLPVNHEDLFS